MTSATVATARERVADVLSRPDSRQAGQDILGILQADPVTDPPIKPARPPRAKRPARAKRAVDVVPPPEPEPVEAPAPTPAHRVRTAAPVGESTTVRFPPKVGPRRLMSTVLVIALTAAAGAGYLAYQEPRMVTIGVAVTLGVLVLVTWAIRAGTPLTRMAVKGGQLEVRQGGLHLWFDLHSHYTPIEVQGTPGRRGWRVLFGRGTMRPFVVDSSLVDPVAFMDVLRSYRPE